MQKASPTIIPKKCLEMSSAVPEVAVKKYHELLSVTNQHHSF
jgi:hypothetical protein